MPTDEELRQAQTTVYPDGRGLPPGGGDAHAGSAVYSRRCASCHGAEGEGIGDFPRLVGGIGSLASGDPVQTVGSFWPYATTLFDYIRRAMPYADPGSLSDEEVYAVTAYLLAANGIVKTTSTIDARTLAAIVMPNRDGFVPDPRPEPRSRCAGDRPGWGASR